MAFTQYTTAFIRVCGSAQYNTFLSSTVNKYSDSISCAILGVKNNINKKKTIL